ncbi:MAG TPA: hypothetical protein VLL48_05660, partial [Longimicrobiales bacterium]|nr:hypothetical protein [Longimicrobiales bacterium]
SEHLSQNEIDAAMSVRFEQFNAQHQPRFVWPDTWLVARAHVDQLERTGAVAAERIQALRADLDRAEGGDGGAYDRLARMASALEAETLTDVAAGRQGTTPRTRALVAQVIRRLMEERNEE